MTRRRCRFILTAGGELIPEVAELTSSVLGVSPHEIFGSTEAGAIAWRNTAVERKRWRPVPGVTISADSDGRLSLRSPFLPDDTALVTDDRIEIDPDGAFRLLGRMDRVLKIEEKRISLPEVEARLRATGLVSDAAVVPLKSASRVFVGAAVVLTEAGQALHAALGPGRFLLKLRQMLRPVLEPVAIPRQVRVVSRIPENTQGKRDVAGLQKLFAPVWPHEVSRSVTECTATLELQVQPELMWFQGHFDGHQILPGVTQLYWVFRYAHEFFGLSKQAFRSVDAIKFQKPLCPGDHTTLALQWEPDHKRLKFTYTLGEEVASSGRITIKGEGTRAD